VSPVGVVGVGGRDFRIEPSLSKHQVLQWLLQLRRFRYDEGTQLRRAVAELMPSLRSRTLVIVLSDLHDEGGIEALKLLGQVHDCVALQLVDPAELLRAGSGFVRAQEAETGKTFVTHGRRQWIRSRGDRAVAAPREHRPPRDPHGPAVRAPGATLLPGARVPERGGTMNALRSLPAWLVLLALALPAQRKLDERTTTVGMRGKIEQVVLPGSELVAKPVAAEAPLVLRVLATFPHGTDSRYDLEYCGLVPGKHDLARYLVRKDGTPASGLPALEVEVRPLLPRARSSRTSSSLPLRRAWAATRP
jgi:hypothetical protein